MELPVFVNPLAGPPPRNYEKFRIRICDHFMLESPLQAMHWTPTRVKNKRGRPRMSWLTTINKDLKVIVVAWEEVIQIA